MSEPMSSVEIEDVLSSIRRLVSDDLRPQTRALRETSQPAIMPPAAQPSDKLLLTPALRIVAEEEPSPAQVAEEVVFHTVRGTVEEAPFVAVEDEAGLSDVQPPVALRADPVAPMADDYDDDGAAAPQGMTVSIPEEVFLEPEPEPFEVAQDSESWADEAEAAVRAELESEATQTAYARFLDEPDEDAMDEVAMRDLVRDIIREELQGTLGERITRNVRKLVRAEIARALAVRDFD